MIQWEGGYSSKWRLMAVNKATWDSEHEVTGLSSVSIEHDMTDDYPLLETATMEIDLPYENGSFASLPDGWYRVEMIADGYSGQSEKVDVATLYLASESGHVERGYDRRSVNGYSVLKPAAGKKVEAGTYAPKGVNGAEHAAKLLRLCTPAPIVVEGSFTLNRHVVFDPADSYLRCAWDLLDAAGWCMQIDGHGRIHIREIGKTPKKNLSRIESCRKLEPGIDYKKDRSKIPNRYVAIYGSERAVVENNDLESPVSIPSRGFVIDEIDTSPVPVNGESLAHYAKRQLEDLSVIDERYSYYREYDPDLMVFDSIGYTMPDQMLSGEYRIVSQSLACSHGIRVKETVSKQTKGYTA